MPKETVYDLSGLYDVQVGWSAGQGVQLGVESHEGRSLAEMLKGDGEDPAGFTGLWGTLDREGCNRLIKTVRRARDAAFGRDE